MGQERLNGLAMMFYHLNVAITPEQGWVLYGTVDKTGFKLVNTGQNLREVVNHSNGCEKLRMNRELIE